jgi:ribosomal protein S18 acetylase RimI-like enzyme
LRPAGDGQEEVELGSQEDAEAKRESGPAERQLPPEDLVFRRAEARDATAIRAILNSAYTGTWTKQNLHVRAATQTVGQTASQIAKGNVFVLARKEIVIGTVRVERKPLHDDSVVAYVTHLARNLDYTGQGFGERLMSEAEEVARRFGATLVTLDTALALEGLVAFYRRLGYSSTGRFMHTKTDFWSVWLEKPIGVELDNAQQL